MDIVLTDWRGTFTSEHPTLLKLPYTENDFYKKLSLMALREAPYIKLSGIPEAQEPAWKVIASIAPEPMFPFSAALLEHPTRARNILVASGDARTLLHVCSLASSVRHSLEKNISGKESAGELPIAIATKHMHTSSLTRDNIHEMNFIGIADTRFDSIPDSHQTLSRLHDKKIQVKIVSSMSLRLSNTIVRAAGLVATEDSCITGDALALMSDSELRGHVGLINVFSELAFADRERITRLLEEDGHRILHHDFSN